MKLIFLFSITVLVLMTVNAQDKKRAILPNVEASATSKPEKNIMSCGIFFFDGKSWSFETETIGGVSYKFAGKFAKHIVRTYETGDADNKEQ